MEIDGDSYTDFFHVLSVLQTNGIARLADALKTAMTVPTLLPHVA
jgi:hypothetical protein